MTDIDPNAWRTLVLDADSQAGLCVIRSLGRRGVPVTAGSEFGHSLGSLSKYSEEALSHPSPTDAPEAFVDRLYGVLDEGDYFAVIPVNDATSKVVSQAKTRLEATGTIVGIGDWDQEQAVYDKARTFELAESLDIPIPETHAPTSLAEVEQLADDIAYPVVVKSRSKYVRDLAGRLQLHRVGDDSYADDPDELVSTYSEVLSKNEHLEAFPPLIQAYVPGETTTTVGLADEGDLQAWFQERRLRTTPASGGNSTLIRGMRDPAMREHAAELLDALSWTGPVQVEFMRTLDGEYYLIEVNGRYWGSVPLAVASGVDVPWLHLCQLAGYTPTSPPVYRDDVVQQRLLYGDFKWLAERLSDGHPSALAEFLATFGYATPVFARTDDPLPSVMAPFRWAEHRANKVYEKAMGAWSSQTDDAPEEVPKQVATAPEESQ